MCAEQTIKSIMFFILISLGTWDCHSSFYFPWSWVVSGKPEPVFSFPVPPPLLSMCSEHSYTLEFLVTNQSGQVVLAGNAP